MENKYKPAYPAKIHESERIEEYKLLGLTKREAFAMAAMRNLATTSVYPKDIAKRAVAIADELLKELEAK